MRSADRFSVNVESNYEDVLTTGTRVEYNRQASVVLERPDRLRIDSESDKGRRSFFDAIYYRPYLAGDDELFVKSYGYAVFPTIGKGGMVVGGAYGKGRVYAGGNYVGDTSMTQMTIGLQLGGQAYSQIIFFEDKRAFDEFTGGNFEFGAQASAVAITAAASAEATTTGTSAGASGGKHDATTTTAGTEFHKGMAVFTVAKGGLMYEASIGGQKFSYTPK